MLNQIDRADTLERNPVFVDPHEVSGNGPTRDQHISSDESLVRAIIDHDPVPGTSKQLEPTRNQIQICATPSGNFEVKVENPGMGQVGLPHSSQPQVEQQQLVRMNSDNTYTVVTESPFNSDGHGNQGGEWVAEGMVGVRTGQEQIQASPSPTSQQPSTQAWSGNYNFKVNFLKLSSTSKNKSWDVSHQYYIFG